MSLCGVSNAQLATAQREKLYLHTDKNNYLQGDTIWYKLYLTEALYHMPSEKSGVAYIELINANKKIVQRYALHVTDGTAFGQFSTDSLFEAGRYLLRAYTRWMRNFGDSLLYQREITLSRKKQQWFISGQTAEIETNGRKSNIRLTFSLKDAQNTPLQNTATQILITDEKERSIRQSTFTTGSDAAARVDFPLTQQQIPQRFHVRIGDDPKHPYAAFRINLKKDIDLQFLPESGHLIAGVENTVAFKAVQENGRSAAVAGRIVDPSSTTITEFAQQYKGMGTFGLIPQPGVRYTAILENGQKFQLPESEINGTLLHVKNNASSGNIEFMIKGAGAALNKPYFLTVQQKGYEIYKTRISLTETTPGVSIQRASFLSGVASARLLTENGQVLNERAFFVNHQDPLSLNISTSKTAYHKKDSVTLKINIRDADQSPAEGSFSIAVTDDQQVEKNREKDPNILSYLLLQSDLKGTIETPGYYVSNTSDSITRAADALMLTQGFIKYNWDSTTFKYEAEPEFVIKGKVIKGIGGKAKNARIVLTGTQKDGEPIMLVTRTNEKGEFVFNQIPPFEASSFGAILMGDDFKKFGRSVTFSNKADTANVQSIIVTNRDADNEATIINNIKLAAQEALANWVRDSTMMENVTVTAKQAVANSQNRNGPGKADLVITDAEIKPEYGKKKNLMDLITAKVKGFHYAGNELYMEDPTGRKSRVWPKFYIDGIDAMKGVGDGFVLLDLLTSFTMPEIRGVEVFFSRNLTEAYIRQSLNPKEQIDVMRDLTVAFEVTTYSGQGPYRKAVMGKSYLFPQPFHYGRTFYAPRYNTPSKTEGITDLRSTIYWNANVMTNEKGEAVLSFYTGDNPGTYTIWMEGMDFKGNTGLQVQKIQVKE
ncbi:hypothetical protein [Niabella drilacis]|nr:hypothetical protein [Niabella drilacis]